MRVKIEEDRAEFRPFKIVITVDKPEDEHALREWASNRVESLDKLRPAPPVGPKLHWLWGSLCGAILRR